jgi:hypothetical protein
VEAVAEAAAVVVDAKVAARTKAADNAKVVAVDRSGKAVVDRSNKVAVNAARPCKAM